MEDDTFDAKKENGWRNRLLVAFVAAAGGGGFFALWWTQESTDAKLEAKAPTWAEQLMNLRSEGEYASLAGEFEDAKLTSIEPDETGAHVRFDLMLKRKSIRLPSGQIIEAKGSRSVEAMGIAKVSKGQWNRLPMVRPTWKPVVVSWVTGLGEVSNLEDEVETEPEQAMFDAYLFRASEPELAAVVHLSALRRLKLWHDAMDFLTGDWLEPRLLKGGTLLNIGLSKELVELVAAEMDAASEQRLSGYLAKKETVPAWRSTLESMRNEQARRLKGNSSRAKPEGHP